jgi:hypothetical protein
MSDRHRAQDILIGSIFGLVLGVMLSLWASVFDHLFLQNASRDFLSWLFGIYSLSLVVVGVILFTYARRFGRQGTTQ